MAISDRADWRTERIRYFLRHGGTTDLEVMAADLDMDVDELIEAIQCEACRSGAMFIVCANPLDLH